MKNFFLGIYHRWKELLREKAFRVSLLAGLAVLLASNIVNYEASMYTSSVPVLSVGDIILDRLPTLDLSFIYIFGIYITELVFYIYPVFFRPERFPFVAKTVGAFYIIRSLFIILTHFGAPPGFFNLPQLQEQWGIGRYFYLNDLFFSGHTGFPYLGALLFWENKKLRWFLLGMSFLQAATVLLMHVHYSIDVFSAYFITYSIYIVSDKIFNELNLSFRQIILKIEQRIYIKKA